MSLIVSDPDAASDIILSVSPYSLSTYESCGELYRLKYVERVTPVTGPSPAAVRGRAMHKGAEVDLREVVRQMKAGQPRQDLPLEEVQQAAVEEFERAERGEDHWQNDDGTVTVKQTEKPAWEMHNESPGKNKDVVANGLTPRWYTEIAPGVNPAAVEQWGSVILDTPAGKVRVRGRLDVEPADGVLADLKHSKFAFGKANYSTTDAAETDPQLTAYDLMYRAKYGEPPKALGYDTVVIKDDRKTGETLVSHVVSPRVEARTDAQIEEYALRVGAVVAGIKAGVFIPARRGDSWKCSMKWCSYFRVCRFGEASIPKQKAA